VYIYIYIKATEPFFLTFFSFQTAPFGTREETPNFQHKQPHAEENTHSPLLVFSSSLHPTCFFSLIHCYCVLTFNFSAQQIKELLIFAKAVPTFYQVGSSFLLTSAIYLEQIFIIGCSLIDLDKCVPLSLRETMMYINARSVDSFFLLGTLSVN
jgi:hypothetical protein